MWARLTFRDLVRREAGMAWQYLSNHPIKYALAVGRQKSCRDVTFVREIGSCIPITSRHRRISKYSPNIIFSKWRSKSSCKHHNSQCETGIISMG